VLGKRRADAAGRRRTGRAAEVRGTASVFWWLEGRRAVRKWLDSFYTMTWCWWCAWPKLRGGGSTGRRRGRAAVEARAHRRCGPGDLARENEIGRVCELQWSRWCSRSTGSGVGGGGGGCRREAGAAAGLWQGGVLGKVKGNGNARV
jgi:hypothetical protein